LITLTTDFGFSEPFAGQMKGVILSIAPDVRIVDLTHGIKVHDITAAALAIGSSYRYFPEDTIHVTVVDPGVGSSRAPIILEACGHLFVGPDNGIFTTIKRDCPQANAWRIKPEGLALESAGSTFHGRDLFAPAAARLALGEPPSAFCEPMKGIITLPFAVPLLEGNVLKGDVIHVDVFGNAITNIRASDVAALRKDAGVALVAEAAGQRCPVVSYYAEAARGPHSLVNSDGYLEIFLFQDSAALKLGLDAGSHIKLMEGS